MRKIIISSLAGAGLLAGLAGLPALAQKAEPGRTPAEAAGYRIALRNCVQCHAITLTDKGANPKAPPFRELEERMGVETAVMQIEDGLLTRHLAMPELKLTERELADLAAYLRSVQAMQPA